ncbi:hypothetical protein L2E82_48648 [Cichorium intybus]|uniref:Uncharacterized protein n=1 Tax=Cichorium intybus TaxID=13427 RepID=A0ACB8YYG3_CICIN|nr:hypothetical protein L2E82_48648 [Cichorium intybus]
MTLGIDFNFTLVVESPCDSAAVPDGAPLSIYQCFQNVRNFLVAAGQLGLPTFEPSDLEQQVFGNIMNRDIPWPKIPEEMSFEAYDLINNLLTENPVQLLGSTGAVETFVPSAKTLDTSYFMSRYIWNPEDEHVDGGSDFDDMSDTDSTCGDSSFGNMLEEEGDECGNLAEFGSTVNVNYSFSNFSFKLSK